MPSYLIQGKKETIEDGETIEAGMHRLGLHPDSYLFVIDGRPVPMDTIPHEDVKVLKVASGG